MGIAEKVKSKYDIRVEKLNALRIHENIMYGIENYYGLKDFHHLSDKELDEKIAGIVFEKARA